MRRLWVSPFLESNARDLAEHERIMTDIRLDRLRTTRRPIASARPAPSTQRRALPAAARRPLPRAASDPTTVCRICHTPASVNTSWLCLACASEVKWLGGLARAGVKVVA